MNTHSCILKNAVLASHCYSIIQCNIMLVLECNSYDNNIIMIPGHVPGRFHERDRCDDHTITVFSRLRTEAVDLNIHWSSSSNTSLEVQERLSTLKNMRPVS